MFVKIWFLVFFLSRETGKQLKFLAPLLPKLSFDGEVFTTNFRDAPMEIFSFTQKLYIKIFSKLIEHEIFSSTETLTKLGCKFASQATFQLFILNFNFLISFSNEVKYYGNLLLKMGILQFIKFFY